MEQKPIEIPVPIPPNNNPGKPNTKIIFLIIFFVALIILALGGFWLWHTNNERQLKTKYEAQLAEQTNTTQHEKQTLEGEKQKLVEENQTLAQKVNELGEKLCKGIWKDGECKMATCTDSDINDRPNDIYIKGTVTYLSPVNGKISEFVDQCQDSNNVIEYICKGSHAGTGVYDARSEIFPCPNGCLDGVCNK